MLVIQTSQILTRHECTSIFKSLGLHISTRKFKMSGLSELFFYMNTTRHNKNMTLRLIQHKATHIFEDLDLHISTQKFNILNLK